MRFRNILTHVIVRSLPVRLGKFERSEMINFSINFERPETTRDCSNCSGVKEVIGVSQMFAKALQKKKIKAA
jgi:hypothetical protein